MDIIFFFSYRKWLIFGIEFRNADHLAEFLKRCWFGHANIFLLIFLRSFAINLSANSIFVIALSFLCTFFYTFV